jgi:hypothetical protein
VDIDGHLKWLQNIYLMLKKWGTFYFSVPIWLQRIEFNAHRVFSLSYLLDIFKDIYIIKSFSYVDDQGSLYTDVKLDKQNIDINYGCTYWCGIFELQK